MRVGESLECFKRVCIDFFCDFSIFHPHQTPLESLQITILGGQALACVASTWKIHQNHSKNAQKHHKITKKWVCSVRVIYKPVSGGWVTFWPPLPLFWKQNNGKKLYFGWAGVSMRCVHMKNRNSRKIPKSQKKIHNCLFRCIQVHLGTYIQIWDSLGVIWTAFRVFKIFPTGKSL